MKLRKHTPLLLLLLPSIGSALLTKAGEEANDKLSYTVDDVDYNDGLTDAPKRHGVPTKDAPVDGKTASRT